MVERYAATSKPPSLSLNLIRQLLDLLAPKDRLKLGLLVIAQFVTSLTEVVGIAMILPLVQLMTGSSLDDGYIGVLHVALGEPPRSDFIVLLGALIVTAFCLKAVFALVVSWRGSGFTARLQFDTQKHLFAAFLAEPYAQHRRRNTSEAIRATGQATSDAFGKVIGGLLSATAALLSIVVMLALLLAVLPVPTLVAVGFLGLVMVLIDRVLGPVTQRASHAAMGAAFDSSKALLESFQGFREVRMLNKADVFLDRYDGTMSTSIQSFRKIGFLQQLPKYVLEVSVIIGITLLMVVLAATNQTSAIGSLAVFVTAAIKLMPTVSGLSSTISTMRSGSAGAVLMLDALREFDTHSDSVSAVLPAPKRGDISVENVVFTFPDGEAPVLRGVSLSIPTATSVAFCGTSGSGKTTLVDVILGLQTPESGQVRFDGLPIADLGGNWRSRIGYIPQDIFLLDDSLAENIAFGERGPDRDDERILECIRLAQLEEFTSSLPDGICTQIGERGTRLSGGQRQRVGIARALYHRPAVLVMDEATSALDNETEDQIIQTITSLAGDMTVIMVAHRLSTVRGVDQLIFMEEGSIVAQGTFDEVRKTNKHFDALVQLGDLSPDESV
ncbi:ABC transporter ATP-binding protein [Tessaracoccus palaemonis]|uniref:ABC transporter ATP-binding protein/permease n=1 Tax=Tessaracoccus palaemonis TaxID=2829499 RepID=A0ABX8SI31_9ACTN|nr:ABC transporter ATP-binding protein [Tessaracoccus palaemonis]QXT62960.1 ABC transporter ATP-binding protein/permease [Tessaracoccus palaemonis]